MPYVHIRASVFAMFYYFRLMGNIGSNIRKLRKDRGWTQVQLAQKLNATQKVVTSYETDHATPTLEKLEKMADLFDVSLDELIGRKKTSSTEVEKKHNGHIHGNSRVAKMQEIFEKLAPLEQWAILKQVKALAKSS